MSPVLLTNLASKRYLMVHLKNRMLDYMSFYLDPVGLIFIDPQTFRISVSLPEVGHGSKKSDFVFGKRNTLPDSIFLYSSF